MLLGKENYERMVEAFIERFLNEMGREPTEEEINEAERLAYLNGDE